MMSPRCGIVEADDPVHEEHRDRDDHRRQHARRQYEEEQVRLPGYPEPREAIGGDRSHRHGEQRRGDRDDQAVHEAVGILRELDLVADLQHPLAAVIDALLPPRRGGVVGRVHGLLHLHALGEEADEGRDLRREQHRRRHCDGKVLRLERGRGDPVDRRQEDDRRDEHDDNCQAIDDGLARGTDCRHLSAPSPG